jgi:hypothetical protein
MWSKRLGGIGSDDGVCISLTAQGEAIVCGAVSGAADLNGNPGDGMESSGYGAGDAFVTSFDSAGKYLFSGTFGGLGSDTGCGVFAGSDGRTYLTGSVTGLADLNADGDKNDGGESPEYGLSDFFISVLEW